MSVKKTCGFSQGLQRLFNDHSLKREKEFFTAFDISYFCLMTISKMLKLKRDENTNMKTINYLTDQAIKKTINDLLMKKNINLKKPFLNEIW
jgi:hypothetical protein